VDIQIIYFLYLKASRLIYIIIRTVFRVLQLLRLELSRQQLSKKSRSKIRTMYNCYTENMSVS